MAETDKKSNVTQEEQEYYDIFVSQGIILARQLVGQLQGNTDPEVIGNMMFQIINRVEVEGEKNGITFPGKVLMHGAGEILSVLLDEAGIEPDEEMVKQIIGVYTGKYLDNAIKTGKMTEEQVVRMGQRAQQTGSAEGLLEA
jgi:DNA-binding protein YbaB